MIYIDILENITPYDLLPGIKDFIKELKENGGKIAIFSASRDTRRKGFKHESNRSWQ
jgi:beta-phosphoglucomutase